MHLCSLFFVSPNPRQTSAFKPRYKHRGFGDKRDSGFITKRRRGCLKCKKRFNTHEVLEKLDIRVVKKDGRREDFDREKLKGGILCACEERLVSLEKIEAMITLIEDKLQNKGKEVKSNLIGELSK